jgi:hypothetical protein
VLTAAPPGEVLTGGGLDPKAKHVVEVGQETPSSADVLGEVKFELPLVRARRPAGPFSIVATTRQLELDVQDMPAGSNGSFDETIPEIVARVVHVWPPLALKASIPLTSTPIPTTRVAYAVPATQSKVGVHTMSLVPGCNATGADANGFCSSCHVVPPSVVAKSDRMCELPVAPESRQSSADEHDTVSKASSPLGKPSSFHVTPPFVVFSNAFDPTAKHSDGDGHETEDSTLNPLGTSSAIQAEDDWALAVPTPNEPNNPKNPARADIAPIARRKRPTIATPQTLTFGVMVRRLCDVCPRPGRAACSPQEWLISGVREHLRPSRSRRILLLEHH